MTEALVETVVHSLRRVLENPRDELGRSQLSWCGALALCGVFSGREGGWPIHALEHGLSAWTDIAHGQGLALLLPRIMAFDSKAIPEKISDFNRRIFGTPSLEEGLVKYMKEVGAWTTLGEILPKASKQELSEIVDKTVDHALEVKGIWKRGEEPYLDNCRPIYREDAKAVLRECLS
jgi:alcohol dehydrogenase YqhD (iron-dependent ADH family)